MRKFFAVLLALFLALFVAVGYSVNKQKISFNDLDFAKIKEILLDFRKTPSESSAFTNTIQPTIELVEEENLTYDERVEKGHYFLDRGFLDFAANEYVKATNLEPKRLDSYFKLFEIHFTLGNYEKAHKNIDTILLLDPDNFEARYFLAQIKLRQGQFEEGKVLLEALAVLHTDDPRFVHDLALVHLMLNDYETAKKQLIQAEVLSPENSDLKVKINRLLSAYKEFEFAQAAEILYLGELLARSFNENGEYELAIFKLKEILKMRSDLRDAWILLGFSYLNLEDYYFALTAFQKAYEIDSAWPATQYFLGVTYQELENFNDAIIYFHYALDNGFVPPVVIHQKLAELYLKTQNYEAAVQSYQAILEMTQDDINAFVRPIWIYLDFLSEPAKALELAERSVTGFPENPMAYNLLGWTQTGVENYVEAQKNLEKAIAMDPTLAAAFLNLGKLHEAQSQNDQAIDAYQKAYELDQNGSIGRSAVERYNQLMQ